MKIYYIRPVGSTLYERALTEVMTKGNKKAIRLITIGFTLMMCCQSLLAADENPVKKLGYDGIGLVQLIITFIAIFMALFEIGKAMLEGDPKRIPSIVAKYGIGVICVYAVPTVYFYIKNAFAGWEG
ncbi:hypothetical protein CS063_01660 [Sporanaerobium hydrogeniformans]|uniref:Uncharacterized protein n=1 Tax=Sporanaerobium hydrogeniformans TaxID=3072179 RepID=A0AC61DH10_9FIRM|nr:hypothetical protein [Sporanaerobium hydrogeniformans]PHV72207.1 hypothetical protein CS063_01660 [Sporanaerobium hydrogeniformans]